MYYFIVLAYNEEKNLPQLFTSIDASTGSLKQPCQVILVNDGSTDGTVASAERFQGSVPVRIVHHRKNSGPGEGFKTGFRTALSLAHKGDIVYTLEADNTCDLLLLPEMERKIERGADVVLASCYAPGGGLRGVSFERKLMSSGVNFLMRLLFPIEHGHTYSSFYRAYRAETLRQAAAVFGEEFILSRGFTSAAEILLKLRRLGAVVDEIPMVLQFDERKGKSKMRVMATIMEYLSFLFREIGLEIRYRLKKAV